MMIDRLTLYNFGVYRGENTFQFAHEKPVALIGGMNGRGKTTFLEAVRLALYGANSVAFQESGHRTYSAYLRALINKDAPERRAYVELQFTAEEEGNQTYLIRREWRPIEHRCEEEVCVSVNGRPDSFLTRNWAMFIENMLPFALSSFYFFDGEKIAEIATSSTDAMLTESIRSMLGIQVLESLKHDLLRSVRRKERQRRQGGGSDDELRESEGQRDALSAELARAQGEIEILQEAVQQLDQALEALRAEYETRGGRIREQKKELIERRSAMLSALSKAEEELQELAAGVLPLAIVRDLLGEIKLQAQDEHDDAVMRQALLQMDSMLEAYGASAREDAPSARRFIDFVRAQTGGESGEALYELSDHALFQLSSLLEAELDRVQEDVRARFARIKALRAQLDEIDRYLALDVDDAKLGELSKELRVKAEERAGKLAEIKLLEQQSSGLSAQLAAANAEHSRRVEAWLERMELRDDDDRMIRYAHLALKLLDQYEIELQRRKTGVLGETITNCYRQLANKKNLIERIEMDPRTLEIRYFDADSQPVPKELLSAGEKQLMVIAILWALAICSRKKLPVIIDTPLSRLDSLHREALIRTYFPQASRQTIILSTDSEINHEYYEMMKDCVGDEFTLNYDETSRSTTIEKGYF